MHEVIIDGYNVIHADDELKSIVRTDLRRARKELSDRIARYLKRRKIRVTLVFDGHGGLTDVDIPVPGTFQILYSCSGQTADELILQILRESRNPRAFTVVTSDMADIGREAGAMGAEVLSSRDFLERIRERSSPGDPASEEVDTKEDVDYWLRQFRRRRDGGDD